MQAEFLSPALPLPLPPKAQKLGIPYTGKEASRNPGLEE